MSYKRSDAGPLSSGAHRIRSPPLEQDNDFGSERSQIIARLAALQRLKDEMARNNRTAMLRTIEQMMEAEHRALLNAQKRDAEPA